MAKKKDETKYEKTFDGNQRVTRDGASVIMSDGTRFKRTVLPSPMQARAVKAEEEALLDELEEEG